MVKPWRLLVLCLCRAGAFPKTIWSFWHDRHKMPKLVQLAVASWRHFAPEHQVRLLDLETFREHLENAMGPEDFPTMVQFSDWLRLALLEAHGGVWFDSTVLLTAPLSLLVNESARLSGVHLEAALFESFFIAASAPHDAIVKGWRDSFAHLAQLNESGYDAQLVALRSAGVEPLNGAMADCSWRSRSPLHRAAHQVLHRVAHVVNSFTFLSGFYLHPCGERYWMHYLKTNVAFNSVLKTRGESVLELYPSLNIHVSDSLETLSSLAVSLDWNSSDIVDFLTTARSADVDLEALRGVKFRKEDRLSLEAVPGVAPTSLVARLQRRLGARHFAEASRLVSRPETPTAEL